MHVFSLNYGNSFQNKIRKKNKQKQTFKLYIERWKCIIIHKQDKEVRHVQHDTTILHQFY